MAKLNEKIIKKYVTSQSQDDECHVTFNCIAKGDKEDIKYFEEDVRQEDGLYHLELWTQAETEGEIINEIADYCFESWGVTLEKVKIIEATLLRFKDYDDLNAEAVESLKTKLSGIDGISFPEEKSTGFNYKMENGNEFWFESEVVEMAESEEVIKESKKAKLNKDAGNVELGVKMFNNATTLGAVESLKESKKRPTIEEIEIKILKDYKGPQHSEVGWNGEFRGIESKKDARLLANFIEDNFPTVSCRVEEDRFDDGYVIYCDGAIDESLKEDTKNDVKQYKQAWNSALDDFKHAYYRLVELMGTAGFDCNEFINTEKAREAMDNSFAPVSLDELAIIDWCNEVEDNISRWTPGEWLDESLKEELIYGLYINGSDKPAEVGSKKEMDEKKAHLEKVSPEDSFHHLNKYVVKKIGHTSWESLEEAKKPYGVGSKAFEKRLADEYTNRLNKYAEAFGFENGAEFQKAIDQDDDLRQELEEYDDGDNFIYLYSFYPDTEKEWEDDIDDYYHEPLLNILADIVKMDPMQESLEESVKEIKFEYTTDPHGLEGEVMAKNKDEAIKKIETILAEKGYVVSDEIINLNNDLDEKLFTPEEQEEYDCDEDGYYEDNGRWGRLVQCGWCGDLCDEDECKYEASFGWLCKNCQSALWSRGEKRFHFIEPGPASEEEEIELKKELGIEESLNESREDYWVISDGENPKRSSVYSEIKDLDKFISELEKAKAKVDGYWELLHYVKGNPIKVWSTKEGRIVENKELVENVSKQEVEKVIKKVGAGKDIGKILNILQDVAFDVVSDKALRRYSKAAMKDIEDCDGTDMMYLNGEAFDWKEFDFRQADMAKAWLRYFDAPDADLIIRTILSDDFVLEESLDEGTNLPYGVLAWNLHQLICSLSDERAWGTWISLFPDGETKEQCMVDFGDKGSYNELKELAEKLYKRHHKYGLFTDDEKVIELAHQFDKKLGLEPIDVISPKKLSTESLKEDKESSVEALAKKLEAALKEQGKNYEVTCDNDSIKVMIKWGDWKHDHSWFAKFSKDFFNKEGHKVTLRRKVTNQNGSDCFSARYLFSNFKKFEESLKESKDDYKFIEAGFGHEDFVKDGEVFKGKGDIKGEMGGEEVYDTCEFEFTPAKEIVKITKIDPIFTKEEIAEIEADLLDNLKTNFDEKSVK